MDALRAAANSPGVQGLINSLVDPPEVQGFALGIHGNYVHLYRNEFGLTATINEILANYEKGLIPALWADECTAAGFISNLAPIYVSIYITTDPSAFRALWNPPTIIPGNYLVIIETVSPFFGAHDRVDHHNPILGGTSVSTAHRQIGGTLGGLIRDSTTSAVYISSCNHVLTDSGGTDVLQRARRDGGTSPANHVADVTHYIPLQPPAGYGFGAPFNKVDVALAEVHPGIQVSSQIRLLPSITNYTQIQSLNLGDDLVFVGKESDYITARIFRYIARMKVDVFRNNVKYYFGDIFEIESRIYMYFGSLSKAGDSGSWVVTENNKIPDELCGMLFAGNGKTSLCCFTENIFKELAAASPTSAFRIH